MLTKRQRDVLSFVQTYQEREGGVSPSCDEIAVGVGIQSKGRTSQVLKALEERGFIRRLAGRCRAIEILKPVPEQIRLRFRVPIYDANTHALKGYLP